MGFNRDELDQRAEELALEREAREAKETDTARMCAQSLMVHLEWMANEGLRLNVGPEGTDPTDVMDMLVDWLGVEPSARQKREAAEAMQGLVLAGWMPNTPAGQV